MSEDHRSADSDAHLIAQAQGGDVEAFGALYERYVRPIYRYIRARVADERDAEDLTEQVFLRSFQTLSRYREQGWPFSAFLYQVARNQLVDSYRQPNLEEPLEAAELVREPGASPDEAVTDVERRQDLERALAELPEDYREVIRLRVILAMPTEMVAAWLGRSEGAVRVLLFRALKSLRQKMDAGHE